MLMNRNGFPIIGLTFFGLFFLAGCLESEAEKSTINNEDSEPDDNQPLGGETLHNTPLNTPVEVVDIDAFELEYGTQRLGVVKAGLSSLSKVENCQPILQHLKDKTIESMEAAVDRNFSRLLEMMRVGDSCPIDNTAILLDGGGKPSGADTSGSTSQSSSASAYSTTNTQVAGVDEADFVKNDDAYIYILADSKLQIISAWPADQAHKTAEVQVAGTPKKLYVTNDRAVVYSSMGLIDQGNSDPYGMDNYSSAGNVGYQWYEQECTYGYDCEFLGDGQYLKITVFDVSDRSKPTILREIDFSGAYLNSRRIDNVVHSVITFPEVSMPSLGYWPQQVQDFLDHCWDYYQKEYPFTEEEVVAMFDELKELNRKVIEDSSIQAFLPNIQDTRYIKGEPVLQEIVMDDCSGFYLSNAGDGKGFLSVVSFESDRLDEMAVSTIVGKPGAVYASRDSLYIAVRHYRETVNDWYFDANEDNGEATTLHKFALLSAPTFSQYLGSGVAKGRILNQFSMDEHNGYLRIATTTGHLPGSGVHSTLSVLALIDGRLEIVGMVDNIAPTEDIRSVRFIGDQGFVVTFKKTDPLFVFDLSQPDWPIITGALKIPGYSTYIHAMDESHLLTMGYDADDQGSFGWFQGIQLQVIDIGDLRNPRLIHKEVIGTRGSTSDAATNHLAFNYFEERDLLAVPMTICEGAAGGGSYGDEMTFSGLLVYRLTVEDGFVSLGGVPHREPGSQTNYYGTCSSWWTNSNSTVKRSIFMSDDEEDYVYSIAFDLMNISRLTELESPIVEIQI